MKKFIITSIFLAFSSFLFSQKTNEKDGYEIRGRIAKAYKGKVYIVEKKEGKILKIDSTEVKNGMYSFKGHNISFPKMMFIQSNNEEQLAPFFLENGVISIYTEDPEKMWWSTQKGTINNEIFYKSRIDETYSIIDSVRSEFTIQQMRDGRGSYEKESIAFKRRSKKGTERARQLSQNIVNRFNDEVISLYILRNHLAYQMSSNELDKQLSEIAPKLHNHPYMKDLRNLLDSKKTVVGNLAPTFNIEDMNGKKIKLTAYKGKYVLLDFWASWCSPCLREIPNLKKLHAQYGGKKLEIIGISLDKEENRWRNTIKKHAMSWTQICDFNTWHGDIPVKYNVQSIPRTILIDPAGKIIAIDLRGKELDDTIEKRLK